LYALAAEGPSEEFGLRAISYAIVSMVPGVLGE
jgi:hypothetical protein